MHKKGMIFLQYGGESRLNFIENLCEMVVSSLMYMIKFCEGFVQEIPSKQNGTFQTRAVWPFLVPLWVTTGSMKSSLAEVGTQESD